MRAYYLIFIICFTAFQTLKAQEQEPEMVTVKGQVQDIYGLNDFVGLYVVNKSMAVGNFANASGYFEIKAKKNDTIMIGCIGYATQYLSMKDSVDQASYNLKVTLYPIKVQLREVTVFAKRDLKDIYNDIEELGFDERDYRPSGMNAAMSPITALYAAFSRRERRLRETYEIINNDRRRELLKELFEKYVAYGIIEMEDEEFDSFIDYCQISDATLQQLTQYEFIMLIKKKYVEYRMLNPNDYYWDNPNWEDR